MILSNDSDLFTPMQIIKSKYNKKIFLISPRKKKSEKLCQIANYVSGITKTNLKESQFPNEIQVYFI